MAISFISAGALAGHTDSITPAYGTGATAGRLAVLQVVSGHADGPIPSTPAGWTRAGSFSGGGGTFGPGTGPRRLTWFVRELAGSDAAPTTVLPSGSAGSVICGRIWILDRSTGTGWQWAATFGEDTTSGTSFSATCLDAVTLKAGDFTLIGYGLPNETAGASAETISASGLTFSAVTHVSDLGTTSGNDARNIQDRATVTAGSGSQAPTVTATLAAASTGVAGVLRLREDIPKGEVTVSPQSVFPPRNLVALSEMLAGGVVTATIYREVGGELTELRGASGVNVVGEDALVRVDGEQPFGVPVIYAARLVDSLGDESLVYSDPITSTVATDVISDAIRGIGAAVTLQAYPEKQRNRDATLFNVGGRTVVVSRRRSAPSGTITVRTLTDEDGDALDECLDQATEGVVLIRKQTTLPRLDGYYAIPADTESPSWYDEVRYWQMEAVKVEGWADVLEAVGFTLQDLADNFATLQDLADQFTPGTLLDIALFDFGG